VADKLDRKQLKQPDEFQVVAGKALQWILKNQARVIAGVVAVAVIALGAWAYSSYRDSREEKAGSALSEALEHASRPLAGEAAPGEPQDSYATKAERDKAVIGALQKVRKDFGGTRAAQTALAELGFHEQAAGDSAAATKDLQDFLSSAGGDHPLRAMAQESLGYALEAQGKLDEAKGAFEKLREDGMPSHADFQAARLALLQGKPDAKAQLEKVAKDYSKEQGIAREANERAELASLPPPGATPPPAEQAAPAQKPPPTSKHAKNAKNAKKK
jgi:predicted negative regulator of RcsB-dependent stress response